MPVLHPSTLAVTVALLCSAAGSFAGVAQQVRVDVRVLPQAAVHRTPVRLGDVAAVESTDAGLAQQFREIPIGSAPNEEALVSLERRRLAAAVRSLQRNSGVDLRWSGAAAVTVSFDAVQQRVGGAEFADAARPLLREWLATRASASSMELARAPSDQVLPMGSVVLEVRPLAAGQPIASRMKLWVDVLVDGRFVKAVPIDFVVQVWQPAWVARRDLRPGEQPQEQLLERREVEAAQYGGRLYAGEGSVFGSSRMRTTLLAGRPLLSEQMETMPAVVRGGHATLISRRGAVELEALVQVLDDGRPGQTIRVRPVASKGVVEALVVDVGQVEVKP